MLSDFIVAHCDKDLSVLVIKGNPSPEDLEKVWSELYKQYIHAIGGAELNGRMQSIKNYVLLEGKVRQASMILDLFKIESWHEKVADSINKFSYNIGAVTKDNLPQMIKRFEASLKTDIIRLSALADQIEKEGKGNDKEVTIASYYDMLVGIGETLKVTLNANEINVFQYCRYVVQYRRHVAQLIKQNR